MKLFLNFVDSPESFSRIAVEFFLVRASNRYVHEVFLPATLLTCISFITLFHAAGTAKSRLHLSIFIVRNLATDQFFVLYELQLNIIPYLVLGRFGYYPNGSISENHASSELPDSVGFLPCHLSPYCHLCRNWYVYAFITSTIIMFIFLFNFHFQWT